MLSSLALFWQSHLQPQRRPRPAAAAEAVQQVAVERDGAGEEVRAGYRVEPAVPAPAGRVLAGGEHPLRRPAGGEDRVSEDLVVTISVMTQR